MIINYNNTPALVLSRYKFTNQNSGYLGGYVSIYRILHKNQIIIYDCFSNKTYKDDYNIERKLRLIRFDL